MASRGPTRAIESTGERSHSTTSITAAEAMKANGTIVAWALFRISWRYGWPVLTAIAAEIRMRFTHEYYVEIAQEERKELTNKLHHANGLRSHPPPHVLHFSKDKTEGYEKKF